MIFCWTNRFTKPLPKDRAWRAWLWVLLAISLLALLSSGAGADEAQPGAAKSSSWTFFDWMMTLLAAVGFGSIVAAFVGSMGARFVAISNHRQQWINALREDIVLYLQEIDRMHFRIGKLLRGGDSDDLEKQQEIRASALLVYRRIRLRLNMTESPSIKLDAALEALKTVDSAVANQDRVDAVIKASAVVLKQEWAVTKYGSLAGLLTGGGTMFFRRWLNAAGLFLGIVGVVFIFLWGPPQPSFQRGDPIGASPNTKLPDGRTVAQQDADTVAQEQHYKSMSQIGLGLIFLGFVFQLTNEFLPRNRGEG
jgi:hypothetical protein